MKFARFLLLAVAFSALASQALPQARIFAAASLRGALEAAFEGWDLEVQISYGGSGAIARQVSLGAPADLVLLANSDWDAWLDANGPKATERLPSLVSNTLVLIGPAGDTPFASQPNVEAILEKLGDGRLAMGHRNAVPAGQYARAWLEAIRAWERVAKHLAETENVRVALAYVARGEAPLGIVYGSDVAAEPRVSILWRMSPETHPDIQYPARALTSEGVAALDHLRSPGAQAAFARYGFVVDTAR